MTKCTRAEVDNAWLPVAKSDSALVERDSKNKTISIMALYISLKFHAVVQQDLLNQANKNEALQ